jgi:hypothetical protein
VKIKTLYTCCEQVGRRGKGYVTITNNARRAHEIKYRIAMAKAAFSKKKALFNSKLKVNLRKKLVKCYI